jgi:hypothetical protein
MLPRCSFRVVPSELGVIDGVDPVVFGGDARLVHVFTGKTLVMADGTSKSRHCLVPQQLHQPDGTLELGEGSTDRVLDAKDGRFWLFPRHRLRQDGEHVAGI